MLVGSNTIKYLTVEWLLSMVPSLNLFAMKHKMVLFFKYKFQKGVELGPSLPAILCCLSWTSPHLMLLWVLSDLFIFFASNLPSVLLFISADNLGDWPKRETYIMYWQMILEFAFSSEIPNCWKQKKKKNSHVGAFWFYVSWEVSPVQNFLKVTRISS